MTSPQPGPYDPRPTTAGGAPEGGLQRPAGRESRSMDQRRERVRVQTERHRIMGYMTLARDGYRSRVSDVLNAPERDFLTLTEATVEPADGGPAEFHPFLTVARRHIVFAVDAPEEE